MSEAIKRLSGVAGKKDDRRDHPLFGLVAMQILQEVCLRYFHFEDAYSERSILFDIQVANRRLFSVVREERQLTYDASFQIQVHIRTVYYFF